MERIEINGRIVWGAILPTPQKHAEPLARQGAYGRLGCLALIALLLVIDPCPAGMADGFRSPCHAGWAAEWRTLEAPVDPGLLAAPFCDRRDARALWECSGGCRAFPLFAAGDEEAGSEDGASAWAGLAQGEGRMALGALRDGMVAGVDRVQGDPEVADEGRHEQRMGGDAALISGQGSGSLEGVDAWGKHGRGAHVVLAQEGRHGRAPRALYRFERGPAAEKVTKQQGIFGLKPLESMRERVF